MNYSEAVRYLLSLGRELAAPTQPAAAKFDLENIRTLAKRLGNPQQTYPSVHIAGTNGKGSTAAMLESVLRTAGLRTGLYTSPHLERINERIRLDGEEISDGDFAEAFTRLHALIEALLAAGPDAGGLAAHPTYFECLTAMAFDCFARSGVDFAVFEVGMGGRLDATNIVTPEVAVIARRAAEMDARLVEVDTAYRLEQMRSSAGPDASEASGGAGCYRAFAAAAHSAKRIELAPPLPGRFQVRNALAALAAARLLAERGFPVDDASIARGIAAVRWPGRLERLRDRPAVFLDGTHNPAGARELLAFWEENFPGRRIYLVYGAMRDKAVDEITGLLFPRAASVIVTQPRQPRAISASVLATMTRNLAANLEVAPEPEEALERALELAAPDDAVFATGSLYLVGDLRGWWSARPAGHSVAKRAHPTAR